MYELKLRKRSNYRMKSSFFFSFTSQQRGQQMPRPSLSHSVGEAISLVQEIIRVRNGNIRSLEEATQIIAGVAQVPDIDILRHIVPIVLQARAIHLAQGCNDTILDARKMMHHRPADIPGFLHPGRLNHWPEKAREEMTLTLKTLTVDRMLERINNPSPTVKGIPPRMHRPRPGAARMNRSAIPAR